MATPKKNTDKVKQAAFLAAYAEVGNVTRAAEISKVARRNHYNWLSDPAYAEAFAQAEQQACDRLEQEARRRAVEGVEEPVFHRGEKCGVVRKYSDTLLIFLLKGAMPHKYKERVQNEVSGSLTIKVVLPDDLGGGADGGN